MLRSSSPAMSEISVGSPSPPPPRSAMAANGFHILNIKRLKPNEVGVAFPQPMAVPQRRKSSAERVKSFSIADILGKKEEKPTEVKSFPTKRLQQSPPAALMSAVMPSIPTTPNNHLLAERLQPPPAAPLLMLDLPNLQKVIPSPWDSSTNHLTPNSNPSSLPIHPFFPPALLHYEQRLAWDYQRQLQEHFHAQAQLLRQMSMDPNIIPSEDGSERSRSSSAGSQCYSPDVNVADEDDVDDENESEGQCSKSDDRLVEKAVKSSVEKSLKSTNDTPLDALFQLSTKNFDEDQDPATLNIFATRPNPKKKRKSRTAFTNHQIFELEKRFLYQKYLSPADRDEIAAGLGLSNAQVITWFQNRRAKLKRDMEELKKDVESVKQLSAHKSFLENVNDLSILKTRPVSRNQPTPHHPPAEVHSAAHTHGNHITGVYTTAPTGGLSEIIQCNISNNNNNKNSNTRNNTTATTIKVEMQTHHPGNLNITTTTFSSINERREADDDNNIDSIASQTSSSGQPQLHWQQQYQPQQHHHQQQPRNLQVNSSRG